MKLKEYKKKFNIKRINFDELDLNKREEKHSKNKMCCPYCNSNSSIDASIFTIDNILEGLNVKCEGCHKWFFVTADINFLNKPIENCVADNKELIESSYAFMDEADEVPDDIPYDNAEWETYTDFAYPLYENLALDNKKEGRCD